MNATESERERLIELSEIFKELTRDALSLTEDLVYSIQQWQISSAFMFLLAALTLWFAVLPYWNLKDLGMTLLYGFFMGIFIFAGIFAIARYRKLRKKYSTLFEIQKALEEEQEK